MGVAVGAALTPLGPSATVAAQSAPVVAGIQSSMAIPSSSASSCSSSCSGSVQLSATPPAQCAGSSHLGFASSDSLRTWESSFLSGSGHASGAHLRSAHSAASPSTSSPSTSKPGRPSQRRPAGVVIMMANPAEGKGIFAPMVVLARNILGKKQFNQLRGKGIALHSQMQSSARV
ncbi:hypothetical protein CBR_g31156 [Chara braunii]|uniref:Uncharacterized protein n=1 Tax=Chara braunii TaxID=69332 RepID=A0A388LEG2_CHABU|nr:hypothetical protein CBR_g31156 [Chara braunii]|eukprot:GBG80700.1 hypothetical protein CBR_g31156 [Chara braunii]